MPKAPKNIKQTPNKKKEVVVHKNLENITKVFQSPKDGSAETDRIAIQGSFKYKQTTHLNHVAPGVQFPDPFWAGEIKETLDDPERIAKLETVDLTRKVTTQQGRNKSGMSWKKGTSLRANRLNVSFKRKTVEERLEERKRKVALK